MVAVVLFALVRSLFVAIFSFWLVSAFRNAACPLRHVNPCTAPS